MKKYLVALLCLGVLSVVANRPAGTQSITLATAAPFVNVCGGACTATVAWNVNGASAASGVTTLTAASTLNVSNLVNGGTYVLKLIQDSGGSRTLTLGTGCTWKVFSGGAGAITLTTTATAVDVLTFVYDGTNCYANLGKNYT